MSDKPLLILPTSLHNVDRDTKNGFSQPKLRTPSAHSQYNKAETQINDILQSFSKQELQLSVQPDSVDIEYILVFELFDSVEEFYKQAKNIGMEWLFELTIGECEPNSDFYYEDGEGKKDTKITNKLYCVSSNKQSLEKLLRFWKSCSESESSKVERGFAKIRDMLLHVKNIRKWDIQDRIEGTGLSEYLSNINDNDEQKIIEIELFYRIDIDKRKEVVENIKEQLKVVNGNILQECIIDDIRYHCILASLPIQSVSSIINRYNEYALFHIDGIMYIRPTSQFYSDITFIDDEENNNLVDNDINSEQRVISEESVIALFDGLPMDRHFVLDNKLNIDDPDDYAKDYEVEYRRHGTSMASYILYGDLNRNDSYLNSKLYVRPILKPYVFSGDNREQVPEGIILVDLVHKAVKRIFDEVKYPIKVINFSIGDPNRPFLYSISPLGKLLDYLSYKYNVLFVISAGNNLNFIDKLSNEINDLKNADISIRTKYCTELVVKYARNFKVISPAESINNLSIGAIFDDFCGVEQDEYSAYFPLIRGMPSPFSYIGYGFNSSVKPDLFYYGGRCMIRDYSHYKLVGSYMKEPGSKSALASTKSINKFLYSMGTSDAAAQITHEIGKCHEILSTILPDSSVSTEYEPLILKAMITHSASYSHIEDKLKQYFNLSGKRDILKYVEYGDLDTKRVLECTATRITFIGYNKILNNKKDVYNIPLPLDLTTKKIKRRLIVTLAYFSPIDTISNVYKKVNIAFDRPESTKLVFPDAYTEVQSHIRNGTLQHVIYDGDKTIPNFNKNIEIDVVRQDKLKYNEAIKYAILITVEFTDGIETNTDIYSSIKDQLQINNKIDSTRIYT